MALRTKTWIALLRGVNVGGKNSLPMKEFVAELEALGFLDVRTYIQSGNAVFRSAAGNAAGNAAAIAVAIGEAIKNRFGFQTSVIVIGKEEFAAAAVSNPFPEGEEQMDGQLDGKALHLFFLGDVPRKLDAKSLDAVKRPSERWQVVGSVFYLCAPEGFGNSKLAARVERCLGVSATARNWRTVCELVKLAEGSG